MCEAGPSVTLKSLCQGQIASLPASQKLQPSITSVPKRSMTSKGTSSIVWDPNLTPRLVGLSIETFCLLASRMLV